MAGEQGGEIRGVRLQVLLVDRHGEIGGGLGGEMIRPFVLEGQFDLGPDGGKVGVRIGRLGRVQLQPALVAFRLFFRRGEPAGIFVVIGPHLGVGDADRVEEVGGAVLHVVHPDPGRHHVAEGVVVEKPLERILGHGNLGFERGVIEGGDGDGPGGVGADELIPTSSGRT